MIEKLLFMQKFEILVLLVQSPVVCSVSVVGEVGERTPMAPRTGSSGKGGGLITSPVVFSNVELSGTGVSRTENIKKYCYSKCRIGRQNI